MMESDVSGIKLGSMFAFGRIWEEESLLKCFPSSQKEQVMNCINELLKYGLIKKKELNDLDIYWSLEAETWDQNQISRISQLRKELTNSYTESSLMVSQKKLLETINEQITQIQSKISKLKSNSITELYFDENNGNKNGSHPGTNGDMNNYGNFDINPQEMTTVRKLQGEISIIESDVVQWGEAAKKAINELCIIYGCSFQDLLNKLKLKNNLTQYIK